MAIDSIDVVVADGATTTPSTPTARHRLGVGKVLRVAAIRDLAGDGPVHVSAVLFRGSTLVMLDGAAGWIRSNELGGGLTWHGAMHIDEPGWFISLSSRNNTGGEVTMQLSWETSR